MVAVAQGRRERKTFAEWWSYSPTEAIITHFMLKVGSRSSAGGREHRVESRLIRFSQRERERRAAARAFKIYLRATRS